MGRTCAHIFISGRVQGVFFRANVLSLANNLKLKGWVKNTSDGKVEVLAEGDKNSIEELIIFCKKGPQGAIVKEVLINYEKSTSTFNDFRVMY